MLGFLSLARKNSEVHSLLEEAAQLIWKLVQLEVYSEEIDDLKSKKTVSSNSKIVSISPFIDSNGILRAKGRLRRTNLPFETKHPVILPSKHRAVELFELSAQNFSSGRGGVYSERSTEEILDIWTKKRAESSETQLCNMSTVY